MYLTHALRAILRTAVATGDALWKYVSLLLSGTPPTQTFIADASVNANVLTLNGDVRPSNLNPYVEGYYSNYFDGTGDTINLPTSTALLGAGNYTVEFWVNLPAAPTGGAYFTVFAWGSSGSVLRCFLLNETVTKLGVWIGATNVVLYPTSAMVGQWAHIALVRSGTTLTAYINGVSVATASDATNYNTGQLYIASQAATNFLTGYISNFRIVVGTAVYTANFTPPTAPLTAISGTSLLTCQSNRFIDNSANNFALTRAGDVAVRGFVPFTPPTTVNVNTLYSTYFDGSGDYLSVPANSVFQFVGDYTIEFWVNFGTVTGNQDLISNYNAGGAADWIVMMSATGIQYYPSSASSYVYTGAGSVISNTWYHVAAVRSGNTCSLYLNGVSVGTPLTFSGTLGDNTKPIYIGSRTGTGGYFTGCMSNLRVVKGTAVYTTNFTPPTSPLTAISGTSLLTCQNATIIDNSTNALAITSFGQAQPVDVSPFTQVTTPVTATYLGSAYFDGSGDYLSATGSALGAGAFTIEMWVYMTSYPNSQNALYSNGTSDSTSSIAAVVYINSSGTLAIYNYPNSITTSTTVPLNQWNHIAVVRNSGTVSLYINGVNGGSGSNSNNITDTAVQVMRGFGGILNSPIGYVSDVRVVKGTAVYTANFAPPATPLTAVANTSLLTLQTDQPAANKQFVDNSGNNLVITQAGNATQGSFSPYGANWSNYFDGTGDYLTVPSNAAFQLGTGDFTFECWFNPTSLASAAINTLFNIGTYSTGLFIRCASIIEIYINNVQRLALSSTGILSTNTWQHVALVRSGSTCKVYVNGVSVATFTDASSISPTTATVTLGMSAHSATETLTGYMSNVRLVKGTAVYTANFTPPTAPLTAIANTSLLTCQSPSLVDNSTNSFAITRNGDVSVQRFSPFSPVIQAPVSYSTYFDGSGDYITTASNGSCAFGSGDFTIEFWLYANSVGATDQGLIDMRPTSTNGYYPYLYMYSGQITYWLNATAVISSASGAITAGSWYHVALTRSGSSNKLFINGIQSGSTFTSTTALLCDNARPVFGSAGTSLGGSPLNGYISNARIVKGTAVYTTAFTPPTAPLTAIANTSLLTCQSPTIVDTSSNALALTGFGNVIQKPFHPFGTTSYSQYFDGNGDYLSVSPVGGGELGTGDFTIEYWMNASPAGSYSGPAGTQEIGGNTTAGMWRCLNRFNFANGIYFAYTTGSTFIDITFTTTNYNDNTWHHVAYVKSGTSLKAYVDGTQVGTAVTVTQSLSSGKKLTLGYNPQDNGYYTGYTSNLRIVKGTAVYTANFTPPTAPLTAIANTSLLTCQNLTAIDNSSNAFTITKNGDVSGSLSNPFPANAYTTTTTGTAYTPALYGGSAYFDGTGDYLTAAANTSFTYGTGNFTIEGWHYLTAASSVTKYLFDQRVSGQGYLPALYVDAGKYVVYINTAIPLNVGTVVSNAWVHWALVKNGSTTTLYINGVSVGSFSDTNNYSATAQFRVGSEFGALGSYDWQGYMSDLRITKGQALYTGGFVPPIAPLQAVKNTTLLLNMDKSGITDSSRCVDLETVGDAKIRYESPYNGNYYSNYFDGSGDSLTTTANAAFGFGTGDFTVEFWVKFTSTVGRQDLVWWGVSSSDRGGLIWNITAGNLTYYISPTVANAINYAWTPITNTWYHIALTRSSGSSKLFINGVQGGSTYTDTKNYSVNNLITVGQDSGAASSYFNGYMSNLLIVKGTAVYTANFTPPTAPLTAIANTSLLTCQSKSFVDNSSNNFTITRNGDVAVRSLNPFQANIANSSMYFDGSGDYLVAPSMLTATGDFTIECWINTTVAVSGYRMLCGGGIDTSATNYLAIYASGVEAQFGSAAATVVTAAYTFVPGSWYHVAMTRSGSTIRVFVNGVSLTTSQGTQTAAFAFRYIANGYAGLIYTGYIADFRITKSARYTANFTPPTAPLPTA